MIRVELSMIFQNLGSIHIITMQQKVLRIKKSHFNADLVLCLDKVYRHTNSRESIKLFNKVKNDTAFTISLFKLGKLY